MATKVFMEALSPTMEEGRLVKWLKAENDAVKSGDVLAEVETDKAIMELVARGDGVLRKRLVGENESRPVGTLVGAIAAPEENIDALIGGAGGGGGAPAPAQATQAADGGRAKAPEQVVARAEEAGSASSVPRTPQQAQGEASAPPQEKVGGADAPPPAKPATAPERPGAPTGGG